MGPPVKDETGEIIGASLVRWASKRARRVCHSTMAAETLAATAGLDAAAGLRFRLWEVGFRPKCVMLTDCRSLFDHVYAMTGKTAEMLLPDIHELREATMPWRHALSDDFRDEFFELWWCATENMLADNLTKARTPSLWNFLDIGEKGRICLGKESEGFIKPRPTQRSFSGNVSFETGLRMSHILNGYMSLALLNPFGEAI